MALATPHDYSDTYLSRRHGAKFISSKRVLKRAKKFYTLKNPTDKTGCSAADFSSSVAETVCRMKVTVMLHIHYSSSDDHPVKCNLRWKCLEVFLLKALAKTLNKLSNLPVMSIHT